MPVRRAAPAADLSTLSDPSRIAAHVAEVFVERAREAKPSFALTLVEATEAAPSE